MDCISELPDDVLVRLLSFLSLREAIATGLLSKRWRYMWTWLPRLDLVYSDQEDTFGIGSCSERLVTRKFVRRVDQIVKFHQALSLDELRIKCFLGKSFSPSISWWLEFAFSKGIRKFTLDLSSFGDCYDSPEENYTVSEDIDDRAFAGFGTLRSLCFKSVNVDQEALEYLLSSCPVLEELSVYGSKSLVNLKVAGSRIKLKRLAICYCRGIERIKICDTNIVSFSYHGDKIDLALTNVPCLVDLSVGESFATPLSDAFAPIADFSSQLESLAINVCGNEDFLHLGKFPELTMLKKLHMRVQLWGDESLLKLASVVTAAPYLQNFVLQLVWMNPPTLNEERVEMDESCEPSHVHLKVVEFGGYCGCDTDDKFIMYLAQTAMALQKIIIKPVKVRWSNTDMEGAEVRAQKRLRERLAPWINLLIL